MQFGQLILSDESFFEHRTNSNMFSHWWLHLSVLYFASNQCRLNIESNRAFIRFTKFLIEKTQILFFRTWKGLKCVHLLVIELEHQQFWPKMTFKPPKNVQIVILRCRNLSKVKLLTKNWPNWHLKILNRIVKIGGTVNSLLNSVNSVFHVVIYSTKAFLSGLLLTSGKITQNR